MKVRDLRIWFLLLILSFSTTGFGCASNRINLVEDGLLKLDRIPSIGCYISKVYVNQVGDGLEISGKVKRRSFAITGGGHVDIAVINPDGEVLEQASNLYKPRIISTKRMHNRESYFNVWIPTIPPTGSIVRVVYHRDSKRDSGSFSCAENRAASKVRI